MVAKMQAAKNHTEGEKVVSHGMFDVTSPASVLPS
jgi:hypothetical protein